MTRRTIRPVEPGSEEWQEIIHKVMKVAIVLLDANGITSPIVGMVVANSPDSGSVLTNANDELALDLFEVAVSALKKRPPDIKCANVVLDNSDRKH